MANADQPGTASGMRQLIKDWIIVIAALVMFGVTGNTPPWAVQSLVRLFCISGGRSNDLIARLLTARHPPRPLPEKPSVLPPLAPKQVDEAATGLRERGYYLYEQRVPQQICDRLLQFALTQPATVRLRDGESRDAFSTVYDPARPLGVRYDFAESDLINHPD